MSAALENTGYPDGAKVLYEYCVMATPPHGVTALYALSGTRVFIGATPKKYTTNQPVVVLAATAPKLSKTAPIDEGTFTARCYGSVSAGGGADDQAAMALALAFARHMNLAGCVVLTSGTLLFAKVLGLGPIGKVPAGADSYVQVTVQIGVTANV